MNDYLTHFFILPRGVRQGCHLSPLLYVLYAEDLGCSFRLILGVGLAAARGVVSLSVVSHYANDTSLVVTTTDAIKAVFQTYAVFALGSGSRLKQVKSKGLRLVSWCGHVDTPVRLYWTSVTLNILATYCGCEICS